MSEKTVSSDFEKAPLTFVADDLKKVLVVCSQRNGADFTCKKNDALKRLFGNNPEYIFCNGILSFPNTINLHDKYDAIWFAGCNLLSSIFSNVTESLLAITSTLKNTGFVVFTENENYVRDYKDSHNLTLPITALGQHTNTISTPQKVDLIIALFKNSFEETIINDHIVYKIKTVALTNDDMIEGSEKEVSTLRQELANCLSKTKSLYEYFTFPKKLKIKYVYPDNNIPTNLPSTGIFGSNKTSTTDRIKAEEPNTDNVYSKVSKIFTNPQIKKVEICDLNQTIQSPEIFMNAKDDWYFLVTLNTKPVIGGRTRKRKHKRGLMCSQKKRKMRTRGRRFK